MSEIRPDSVRAQIDKILSSRHFAKSERLCRFLRFSVEHTLSGSDERLKEYRVGVEVFDRRPDYDPRIDPIVRVEARRLRAKLKSYYDGSGRADPLVIEFPKGAYMPFFRARSASLAKPKLSKASESRSCEPVLGEPGLGGTGLGDRGTGNGSKNKQTGIAVLPFANLSPVLAEDFFSDGLTEELIHRLTRVPGLRVVAWNTASQLRGREQDLGGLRDQLHVDVVLRGSIRRGPGSIRVTVQLIDTGTGAYLWSEAYDRDLQDILAIQYEIAQAVVKTLQLTLAPLRRQPGPLELVSPECYSLYLQGRFHWNQRTRDGLTRAVQCFEQALALNANFALAYAGVADAYSLLAEYGIMHPAEAMPAAKRAALRALELDAYSAEAYTSLALISSHNEWRWAESEDLYRRAIEINPGYATAHHWFAVDLLAILGRFEEALPEIRMAVNLDPLSLILHEGQAFLWLLARQYDEALRLYGRALDMSGGYYKARSAIGRIHMLRGDYQAAIESLRQARTLAPGIPSIVAALGQAFGLSGETEAARAHLEELDTMARTEYVPSTCFAVVHLGLGEKQQALDWVSKAVDNRETAIINLKVHPVYDPLRREPAFHKILHRIGLAD